MALLFLDGCDLYDHNEDADLDFRWGYGSTTFIAPRATSGRFGGGAIELVASGGSSGFCDASFPASTTIILGAALHLANGTPNAPGVADTIVWLYDSGGTLQVYLQYDDGDRLLRASRGDNTLLATASATWPLRTWRYLELKLTLDDVAGSLELRLDGQSVASFSGDTRNGGAGDIAMVRFRAHEAGSQDHNLFVDDVYVCDTSGAACNDFLGDVRVETLRPNGDTAQADWTPSSGNQHFALVDEAPGFNTTDYVESDTPGHLDLWGYGELGATPVAIHAVQLVTAMQKTDAGTREARAVLKSGATTLNGATRALSTSWLQYEDRFETDPDTGAAWTPSAIEAIQAGVEVVT